MRIPASHFAGNLMWTRSGTVYATWGLTPLPAGRSDEDLQFVADAHTALYRALAGKEVLLRGLLVWTDPVAVVARMVDGVALHTHQAWAEECEATIDQLADLPLGSRRWTLTLPLSAGSWNRRVKVAARAAFTDLCDQLRLPTLPPGDDEIARYQQVAGALQTNLPPTFRLTPLTVAEQLWGLRQAQGRGAELWPDPHDVPDLAGDLWTQRGRSAVGDPVLDPGGLTDLPGSRTAAFTAPINRRWLKVVTDTGAVSYQAGLVLANPPAGGMATPGGEFLGRIDDMGIPLDVAIRLTVRSRHEALRRNKRGFHQLADQVDQVDASEAFASLSSSLQESAQLLAEYNQRLSLDTKEVEVEPVVLLSTAAATAEAADDFARHFQQHPVNKDFLWARPVGAEADVFWAMQPGGQLTPQLRDYRHITTGQDFAAAAPLLTQQLGAARGPLLGLNRSSPLLSPVFVDLIGESQRNAAPSIAFAAELGAGKSFSLKKITGDEIDRGTKVVALDGSKTREWASFAAALGVDTAVADVEHPAVSLDPLRVLPVHQAGPVLQSFLTKLGDFSATSGAGRTLAKALKPAYLTEHRIRSAGGLLRHLAGDGCSLPLAAEIADRIGVFADPDMTGSLGDIVFDETLPPLDLRAQMTVIGTHGVKLPTTAELTNEHLYNRLGVDKLFGQAFFLLAARYAYEVCFGDPAQAAMFVVDETWRVTLSVEGAAIVLEFVRDGRKAKAAIMLGSHDPSTDFGNDTISSLIGYKVAMRHRDPKMAAKAVSWLGFDPEERPDLVEAVQSLSPQDPTGHVPIERRGEAVMVDAKGQFGHLQVLAPARPHRAAAAMSTPPDQVPA